MKPSQLKEKIAITGANGFIGRYLCEHLLAHGFGVVALVRKPGHQFNPQVTVKVVPELESGDAGRALDGCDVVIHLAGRAHVLNEIADDPLSEFRKANVESVRTLMNGAASAGVSRIIFVSSIGVNGNCTAERGFLETDPEQPYDAYSLTKLEAEAQVKELAQQHRMDYVIVRPALVFGPDAPGNFGKLLRLSARNLPVPFKNFRAKRNILSIWNLVAFLEVCAIHPLAANEIFLIADEQEITLPEIFKYLRFGMNMKPKIWSASPVILSALAALAGKQSSISKLNSDLRIDTGKARSVLSWSPILDSFDALRKTGEEYRKKMKYETHI